MTDIEPLHADDPRSLGHYALLGRLGEGAQGVVYLARSPVGEAQVAVKLLRAHLSQNAAARSRFLREVAAAKRVARFCTAQVLDADLAGSQPYLVSEYIPGRSLAAVVRTEGPRNGTALERIAVNTATALAGIHQAGIVHRDFKASNVLLGPDGPVVIDFGIAKALDAVDSELTLTGQSAGTPSYMAPEQFGSGPPGSAMDVFAWGVTMAFAATGVLPFGSGQVPAVIYRVLNEPPVLDGLTGPLRGLVAACLDKDPAARPTARGIVDRLLGRADLPEPAAAAMPPAPDATPYPATFGQPSAAVPHPDPALYLATDPAATPPLDGPPPLPTGPIRAVRMEPLRTDLNVFQAAACKAAPSRRVLAGAAAAAALLLLLGGAVAVKAFTGQPGAGNSARARVDTAGLRSDPASVTPSARPSAKSSGKPSGKKKRAGRNGAHSHATPPASSRAGTHAQTPSPVPSTARPPAQPSASPQPSASGTPNPYTPGQVCGPGYGVIDSHALAGGTIYLLYDSADGKNCVTTMRSLVSGKIMMVATLKVEGGPSATDSGLYTDYAGPVALAAPATCVEWGGAIGNSSWTSTWSHCS